LKIAANIRRAIAALAMLLLVTLGFLKWHGVDQKLMLILVIAAGLLVGLLLITYRAFVGVVAAAESRPEPLASELDDEDKR
jgi:hypothetical protein